MNLSCPRCNSESTQKLSLVMAQGGMMEKGAKFGAAYMLNIVLPLITVIFAIMFGFVFGMFSSIMGLLAFAGTLFAGFTLRGWLKGKAKSKYADLPSQMKQDGYQCSRCENLFIPA